MTQTIRPRHEQTFPSGTDAIRFGADGNGVFVAVFDGGAWHLHTSPETVTVLMPSVERCYSVAQVQAYLRGEWSHPDELHPSDHDRRGA